MKNLNNKENLTTKQEMEDRLAVINKANKCDVFMRSLCQELGLIPEETTHQSFVERFSELQKKSLEYQKELQQMYVSSSQVKPKQKRTKKYQEDPERIDYQEELPDNYNDPDYQEALKALEKTDTFSNGDYK